MLLKYKIDLFIFNVNPNLENVMKIFEMIKIGLAYLFVASVMAIAFLGFFNVGDYLQ